MLPDRERELLELMRDGYQLLTGKGLWGIHCTLIRGGEKKLVHRSLFSRLRNEGYVRYASPNFEKGMKTQTRLLAVLTDKGKKALEPEDG